VKWVLYDERWTRGGVPLTVGVGVTLDPALAAVDTISALLNRCAIEVERTEPPVEASV
jgi:hypothetical protein